MYYINEFGLSILNKLVEKYMRLGGKYLNLDVHIPDDYICLQFYEINLFDDTLCLVIKDNAMCGNCALDSFNRFKNIKRKLNEIR